MSHVLQIGWWIERDARKVTDYTSYAADHIEKVTKPGRYPLRLSFETGYTIPMPYWLLCKIDAETIGGGYYSGFAGNNFAFTPADKGDSQTFVQMYSYQIKELVESGRVELLPEFSDAVEMSENHVTWAEKRGFTWESLATLSPVA